MRFFSVLAGFLLLCTSAFAVPAEQDYAINPKEDVPDVEKLIKEYRKQNSGFDRHFAFRWAMPKKFDRQFENVYQALAADERHISSKMEEVLYQKLKQMPKEMYPYIGPYLHTLPQLSGRILDMPGIKETKNKFPDVVAEKYKDIENIEYLSPWLYILLMPEMAGEKEFAYEYPQFQEPQYTSLKKRTINPEFLQKIADQTPVSATGSAKNDDDNDGIRHYVMTPTTPLSGEDVKAFSNTLSDLYDFNMENRIKLIYTKSLISYWEEKNGGKKNFYFYKQLANPCAAMVRNIRWNNKAADFQSVIGKNGFGLDDWALVCDKTLKAYRRANMSLAMMLSIRGIQSGAIERYYNANGVSGEALEGISNMLGAAKEMYNAPKEDVNTVKPYMSLLSKKMPAVNSYFLGAPLMFP